MDLLLAGNKRLVTRGSSGIRAEIARLNAAEIARTGREAVVAPGDLMIREGRATTIPAATGVFGGTNIFVSNSGASNVDAARSEFETIEEGWAENCRQDALPKVALAQAFVPGMKDHGWGCRIQNFFRNAISAYVEFASYGAAKGGFSNLTFSGSRG